MDEENVSPLTHKFNKFLLKSKRNKKKNFNRSKEKEIKEKKLIYYEYKKLNHIRQEYSFLKEKRKKGKKKIQKK